MSLRAEETGEREGPIAVLSPSLRQPREQGAWWSCSSSWAAAANNRCRYQRKRPEDPEHGGSPARCTVGAQIHASAIRRQKEGAQHRGPPAENQYKRAGMHAAWLLMCWQPELETREHLMIHLWLLADCIHAWSSKRQHSACQTGQGFREIFWRISRPNLHVWAGTIWDWCWQAQARADWAGHQTEIPANQHCPRQRADGAVQASHELESGRIWAVGRCQQAEGRWQHGSWKVCSAGWGSHQGFDSESRKSLQRGSDKKARAGKRDHRDTGKCGAPSSLACPTLLCQIAGSRSQEYFRPCSGPCKPLHTRLRHKACLYSSSGSLALMQ